MKRAAPLALAALVAACGPKRGGRAASTPAPTPAFERAAVTASVPVKVWSREAPFDILTPGLAEKEGVLKKTPAPSGESLARSWPYSIDAWGIARTDLGPLLGPYEGAAIRVRGVFRKVYTDDTWHYEVDPEQIILLPKK